MPPSARRGWYQLLGCSAVVVIVWLAVLPQLSDLPAVRSRTEFNESKGIDPAAMFYTDLEATSRAYDRAAEFQKQRPQALWSWPRD